MVTSSGGLVAPPRSTAASSSGARVRRLSTPGRDPQVLGSSAAAASASATSRP